jgi:hypothetical protein
MSKAIRHKSKAVKANSNGQTDKQKQTDNWKSKLKRQIHDSRSLYQQIYSRVGASVEIIGLVK